MASANQDAYGNPAWGTTPPAGASSRGNTGPDYRGPNHRAQGWGPSAGWTGPSVWNPTGGNRGLAIVAMILGFIFWWPVGLAILFYSIWSGRMGCWGRRNRAAYEAGNWQSQGAANGQTPWSAWKSWVGGDRPAAAHTSGNRAFDEYKAETLRRLEEEQQEFGSFLERLRFAKDKAEFDEFMAERRQQPRPPAQPEASQPQV